MLVPADANVVKNALHETGETAPVVRRNRGRRRTRLAGKRACGGTLVGLASREGHHRDNNCGRTKNAEERECDVAQRLSRATAGFLRPQDCVALIERESGCRSY